MKIFLHGIILLLLLAVTSFTSASGGSIGSICNSDLDCQTISNTSYIIGYLKDTNSSNVTVNFERSFSLSDSLHFENLNSSLKSIHLRGDPDNIRISCVSDGLELTQGLYFNGVESISLTDITIENCGLAKKIDMVSKSAYSSAVYFVNCIDVMLESVTIRNSLGTGVTLLNNSGFVDFTECMVEKSGLPEDVRGSYSGGSGVLVHINNTNNSEVVFQNCRFLENIATSNDERVFSHTFKGRQILHGRGGAIYITISSTSSNNNVTLDDCTIRGNEAKWGGGISILYHGNPQMNRITVKGTTIEHNRSNKLSGGGSNIGFLLDDNKYGDNFVRFTRCNFTHNSANLYGGGVSIYSSQLMSSDPDIHFMVFEDCQWEGNSALSGSAVDIAPTVDDLHINGVYPVPQFVDCRFTSNKLQERLCHLSKDFGTTDLNTTDSNTRPNVTVSETGDGAILITAFTVQFLGETLIANNTGSGIYLSSGVVTLCDNSSTKFEGNEGRNGGALSIMTFATVVVHDNARLEFTDNKASLKGGAIYTNSIDPHEYLSPRSCFIQYFKITDTTDHGIVFSFKGNEAQTGNDVYSSSVQSCSCEEYADNIMETFLCIGNLTDSLSFDLTTNTDDFKLVETANPSILSPVIPGSSYYSIPLMAFDEYNNSKSVFYQVTESYDEDSALEARSAYVSQNQIQFVGDVNETSLVLKLQIDTLTIFFDVQSVKLCPPGFVLIDRECRCAAIKTFGISYCAQNHSFILHGFWIGLCDHNQICSSHCPLGFCSYKKDKNGVHALPIDANDLTEYVCDERRKGVLCGECRDGNSTYYHSYMFRCGDDHLCKYGLLFYLLSELLPLTLMFFIIIICDIRFTVGGVNGFIFYSQVLDSISVDANGAIPFPDSLEVLTEIHRFIYRTLNFDFFSLEKLAFCLWKNATSLDMLAMKYVTILYALILLILLIVFMNTGKCKRAFSCWRPRTIKSSAKNGITAFIVICYSQCARVSFQILSPAYLYGENFIVVTQVVFRKGNYASFGREHIRYALPAIAVLVIVSIVPLLLILYPLVFKILALFKINDTKLANFISRLFPIPLLDSFQSSFKDNFRFFSGLYFLYRLLALAAYAYSPTIIIFYTFVEVQLIIVLALHSVVQPYKSKWHNIIDSFIFANLALINSFTLFNFFWVIIVGSKSVGNNKDKVLYASLSIQAILIYLPLFCVVAYFSFVVFKKAKSRFRKDVSSLADSVDLPPLRDETVGESLEYSRFNNKSLLSTNATAYSY